MNEKIQQQIITWVGTISILALIGTVILLKLSAVHTDAILVLLGVTSTGIGILGGILTGTRTQDEEEE